MSLSTPELPLDIIHAVLEQLKLPEDASTLSSCSRVGRDWLPVARKYLFGAVTVRARPDAVNLPQGWEALYTHFIKPTHSDLTLITHLHLAGSFTQDLDFTRLVPLFASLPILKHLCIGFWNVLALGKPSQPIDSLPTLEVLELRDLVCYTGSTQGTRGDIPHQTLLNILHHVPHAKTVVFSKIPVSYDGEPLAESIFPHLDVPAGFAPSSVHLSSEKTDNHFLIHLFQRSPHTPRTLRALHIAFDEFIYVAPSFGQLLKNARSLEVLEVDFSDLEDYVAGNDLDPLRAVYAFTTHISPVFAEAADSSLHTAVLIAPSAPSEYWQVCLALLAHLPESVRCIELRVAFDSEMELPLEDLNWSLTGLDVAKVVLSSCPLGPAGEARRTAWSAYLHGGLPDPATEGILQVWFSTSGL